MFTSNESTQPPSDTWLILRWRSAWWEDLAVCSHITSFLILVCLEGSSLIPPGKWTCLQRTRVKHTFGLWQHSSRRVLHPKAGQQHHSTSLFSVIGHPAVSLSGSQVCVVCCAAMEPLRHRRRTNPETRRHSWLEVCALLVWKIECVYFWRGCCKSLTLVQHGWQRAVTKRQPSLGLIQ